MTVLTIRRLPADVIDALRDLAHEHKAPSLEALLREILTRAAFEPAQSWRCFHCGDVFTTPSAAAGHFGIDQLQEPGCVAVLRHGESHLLDRIRELEQQLREYEDGSTKMQRWAQAKFASHGEALVREEEKGFARGVADMLALPEDELAKLREGRKAA